MATRIMLYLLGVLSARYVTDEILNKPINAINGTCVFNLTLSAV